MTPQIDSLVLQEVMQACLDSVRYQNKLNETDETMKDEVSVMDIQYETLVDFREMLSMHPEPEVAAHFEDVLETFMLAEEEDDHSLDPEDDVEILGHEEGTFVSDESPITLVPRDNGNDGDPGGDGSGEPASD